jgi:ribosomal protein S18 acetylase RimI-like enzyme
MMATTLQIVRVDWNNRFHGDAFVSLLDEYAKDRMGGGAPLPETVRATLVEKARKEPNFGAFLAYGADCPAGLLTFVRGFSTFAAAPLLAIHDIVVHPHHRRLGIGRALLEAATYEARSQGCCKLTLEVLDKNEVAQALYRDVGFAEYTLDPAQGRAYFWQMKL